MAHVAMIKSGCEASYLMTDWHYIMLALCIIYGSLLLFTFAAATAHALRQAVDQTRKARDRELNHIAKMKGFFNVSLTEMQDMYPFEYHLAVWTVQTFFCISLGYSIGTCVLKSCTSPLDDILTCWLYAAASCLCVILASSAVWCLAWLKIKARDLAKQNSQDATRLRERKSDMEERHQAKGTTEEKASLIRAPRLISKQTSLNELRSTGFAGLKTPSLIDLTAGDESTDLSDESPSDICEEARGSGLTQATVKQYQIESLRREHGLEPADDHVLDTVNEQTLRKPQEMFAEHSDGEEHGTMDDVSSIEVGSQSINPDGEARDIGWEGIEEGPEDEDWDWLPRRAWTL